MRPLFSVCKRKAQRETGDGTCALHGGGTYAGLLATSRQIPEIAMSGSVNVNSFLMRGERRSKEPVATGGRSAQSCFSWLQIPHAKGQPVQGRQRLAAEIPRRSNWYCIG